MVKRLEERLTEITGNRTILEELGISPEYKGYRGLLATGELQKNYKTLRDYKIPKERIASFPEILNAGNGTIKETYQTLVELGFRSEKIQFHANLLGRNATRLREHYTLLRSLGLTDDAIQRRTELLTMDPETVECNYREMKRIGLSDEKILSHAQILGMNPRTVRGNYNAHIRLLREDSRDRNSGRTTLTTFAQLLSIRPETIEANIQFLRGYEIRPQGILLGTTTKTKRRKIAWILREIFKYRDLEEEQKQDARKRLKEFIRKNPELLEYSLSTLEKQKQRLTERAYE